MTTSVRAARAFARGQRSRGWLDLYAIGFSLVIIGVLLSNVLASPFTRLAAAQGATSPGQAAAGAALVAGVAAGLVALAQAFGPLALSPADTSWLLLTPLDRRGVLRRPAIATATVAALIGALGGLLMLAMAGPYLRPAAHRQLAGLLVLAAAGGAALFAAAVLAAVLVQPSSPGRLRLRIACVCVAGAAAVLAVAADRWTGLSHAFTSAFAGLTVTWTGLAAAVALACALVFAGLVRAALPRFPAGMLVAESRRAGTTRMAVSFGNFALLSWIFEDNHWRAQRLTSRPWPRLPPAYALAWADWRRLSRRPGSLVALAVSTLAPALAGVAITGKDRGDVIAAALVVGAIAAGTRGTAATRRDTNDPTLRRLLGVDVSAGLAARAVLPALLSAGWLMIALLLLVPAGLLHGWGWLLLGLLAGPGAAAAAIRIARTGPVNPGDQGQQTPLGPVPSWLITRVFSLILGVAGCFPLLKAVRAGHLPASTFTSQIVFSAVVLGGYLMISRAMARTGT